MGNARFVFVLGAAVVALGSGCISLSTLQTARAVPDGMLRSAVGVTVVTISPPSSGGSSSTQVIVPVPEVALRYGLGGGRDLGIKGGPLGAQVEFKQEVVSQGPLVIAVAPAAGFLFTSNAVDVNTRGTVLALHLPLLFGVDLAGGHEILFGPRLSQLVSWSSTNTRTTSQASTLMGATFGFAFGTSKSLRVRPEVSFATKIAGDGQNGGIGFQFGLGFLFGG